MLVSLDRRKWELFLTRPGGDNGMEKINREDVMGCVPFLLSPLCRALKKLVWILSSMEIKAEDWK